MAADPTAFLRYCDAVLRIGCRGRQPDCGRTAARAVMARDVAHHGRFIRYRIHSRRIPGAPLENENSQPKGERY